MFISVISISASRGYCTPVWGLPVVPSFGESGRSSEEEARNRDWPSTRRCDTFGQQQTFRLLDYSGMLLSIYISYAWNLTTPFFLPIGCVFTLTVFPPVSSKTNAPERFEPGSLSGGKCWSVGLISLSFSLSRSLSPSLKFERVAQIILYLLRCRKISRWRGTTRLTILIPRRAITERPWKNRLWLDKYVSTWNLNRT